MTEQLILCECSSAEHQMIFRADDEEVFVTFHLAPLPFFKRLWHGLKYIFGYRCQYGDFDELIMRKEDSWKLRKVIASLEAKEDTDYYSGQVTTAATEKT